MITVRYDLSDSRPDDKGKSEEEHEGSSAEEAGIKEPKRAAAGLAQGIQAPEISVLSAGVGLAMAGFAFRPGLIKGRSEGRRLIGRWPSNIFRNRQRSFEGIYPQPLLRIVAPLRLQDLRIALPGTPGKS
jgi:hypothetical protein